MGSWGVVLASFVVGIDMRNPLRCEQNFTVGGQYVCRTHFNNGSQGFDKKITFQRYTADSSKKLKFPPQQRYLRFTEEEWEANIKGAITADFGRFRAVGGKSSNSTATAKLDDRLLAREGAATST